MPYIIPRRRYELNPDIETLAGQIRSVGELNYVMSKLAAVYITRLLNSDYTFLAMVVGTFDLAKQEFIRRVVNPYEDKKIQENGDLPEFQQ